MIKPPPSPTTYADRDLDCQMALEDEIQALTKRAEAAGWKSGEVASALLAFAATHIKARIGAASAERATKAAREQTEGR